MWNGMLSPRVSKSLADHFNVIDIVEDDLLGVVSVTVIFHKTPEKQYVFEIEQSRFSAEKEAIGEEIMRQLQA